MSGCLAQAIIDRNQPGRLDGGMMGGMQVMAGLLSPALYKRKAAETILYLRQNRATLKAWGRSHHRADAILLERAAAFRREAARLAAIARAA